MALESHRFSELWQGLIKRLREKRDLSQTSRSDILRKNLNLMIRPMCERM